MRGYDKSNAMRHELIVGGALTAKGIFHSNKSSHKRDKGLILIDIVPHQYPAKLIPCPFLNNN